MSDIITSDNEEATRVSTDVAISGDRNVIKKESENIIKYKYFAIQIQRLWNVKNRSDASNNRSNWSHFKITQTIPEQLTRKAGNQGTAESSHSGHCTLTAVSADVKVQNIFNMRNNITCSINCKYRTATTLCILETWFVLGIYF